MQDRACKHAKAICQEEEKAPLYYLRSFRANNKINLKAGFALMLSTALRLVGTGQWIAMDNIEGEIDQTFCQTRLSAFISK